MNKKTGKPKLKLLSKEIINNLTEKDIEALKDEFGIDLNEPQIKQFDVTRERIRKIKEKALKMLRNNGGNNDPGAA